MVDPLLSETHVCNATAIPSQYLNRRGQGLHREGQLILSDFGFSSPLTVRILAEEVLYDEGVTYTCLLISRPLLSSSSSSSSSSLPLPTEKNSAAVLSSSSSPWEQTCGPQAECQFLMDGRESSCRLSASSKSIEEEKKEIRAMESFVLRAADQWWTGRGRDCKGGGGGREEEARRDVEEEISFFKNTYIYALGCEEEVAARLNEVIHACLDRIRPLVASSSSSSSRSSSSVLGGKAEGLLSSSASPFSLTDKLGKNPQTSFSDSSKDSSSSLQQLPSHVESFVFLRLHDALWSFAVRALSKRQEKLERKLETLRNRVNSCIFEKLHVKSLLRGVSLHRAAILFDEISAVKLPEQKSLILRLIVRSIQSACCQHVAVQKLQAKKRQQQASRRDFPARKKVLFDSSRGQEEGAEEEEEGREQQRGNQHLRQSQPVEISVDDLVGLVLAAVVLNGGKFVLANLWFMTIFNYMKPRENQYAESGFYLTALHSALSFAFFSPSVSAGTEEDRRPR